MNQFAPDFVLHEQTKKQVVQYLSRPSHSLLLTGSNGVGKAHLAEAILAAVLQIDSAQLSGYPYYTHIQPHNESISIENIRDLQRFLQLKTVGKQPLRRAVLIEHAERMTIEAQNAYLKLLEEPPADTCMILTVDTPQALLPTIRSRAPAIAVTAPDETALRVHFSSLGKKEAAISQAFLLSGGLPGLMHALLHDDQDHPLSQGVTSAKAILQKSLFERLAMVESLSKKKDDATHTMVAMQHIAQTCLDQAAVKQDAAKIKQWHHILKVSTHALDALRQNANPKLTLSHLMLQL